MTVDDVAIVRQGYNYIVPKAEHGLALQDRSFALGPPRRYSATGILFTLIVVQALAAILAATAWLSWILLSAAIGGQASTLAVLGLLMCVAAFSWRTSQGFVRSLIMVGFGGFTLLFAALFAVAGDALILGN